jgi:CBS domain-containing protein
MSISGTIGDLAIPLADYPHVGAAATLREVYATLQKKYDSAEQFRSVLMIDDNGRLLGMLGLRDLLHALLPDYLRNAPSRFQGKGEDIAALALLWQEDCAEHCRSAGTALARAHLTPIQATLAPHDPFSKAVYLFATQAINILPVMENGRVTGVLRLVDVLTEVSQVMLGNEGVAS